MPLYEYACRACGHAFEHLALPGKPAAACPLCHGADLERLLSSFAVNSDGISQRNIQVARRASARGADRVDKHMADHDYVRNHYADEGVTIPPAGDKK